MLLWLAHMLCRVVGRGRAESGCPPPHTSPPQSRPWCGSVYHQDHRFHHRHSRQPRPATQLVNQSYRQSVFINNKKKRMNGQTNKQTNKPYLVEGSPPVYRPRSGWPPPHTGPGLSRIEPVTCWPGHTWRHSLTKVPMVTNPPRLEKQSEVIYSHVTFSN